MRRYLWNAFALAGGLLLGLAVPTLISPDSRAEIDAQSANSLEIRGSGAMGQLARALAEQYMTDHPDSIVTVQTCGSFQGLKSLIVGTAQVAMATDEVPEELAKLALDRDVQLKRTDIYRDALAVVVHASNPVTNLTSRQLRDIFRGVVVNWQEVGGDDAPIEVLVPTSTSATYEVFKRRVLGDDAVMTPKATLLNYKQLKETLHEHSIAYAGLSQKVKLGLQGVTIDGVEPSAQTVASGKYPIVRKMSLYQRVPSTDLGDKVVQYFLAPERGRKLIVEAGNVPVN